MASWISNNLLENGGSIRKNINNMRELLETLTEESTLKIQPHTLHKNGLKMDHRTKHKT